MSSTSSWFTTKQNAVSGGGGSGSTTTTTSISNNTPSKNSNGAAAPPITTSFAQLFAGSKGNKSQQPTTTKQQQSIPSNVPSISSNAVLEILKGFKLEGSDDKYQTTVVFAKSNGELLGGEDASLVGIRWFRAAEGGRFDELHVNRPFFQPSVDDVDNRLCAQCFDLQDETSSSFAEYGPLKLDPRVSQAVAFPNTTVEASISGLKYEVGRSTAEPHLVCLKRVDTGTEEQIPSWKIIANEMKKVMMGDGREVEFKTAADRDIATLLVRTNPPRSKSSSLCSLEEVNERKNEVNMEKQLRDRIMELEAQLMAARARGGAAETGKALAEAQSIRRELEKAKTEMANLNEQLTSLRKSKSDLEEKNRALERETAIMLAKEQAQTNLQRELEIAKESLQKAKEQLTKAKERAERAELSLDELDRSIPVLQSRAEAAESLVADLKSQVAHAVADAERAIGRKNAAQQKADSLAKDLARMLKATPGGLEEVEATIRDNASLKQTVDELRMELKATRAAYDAQLASARTHAAKSTGGIGLGSGNREPSSKATQLEQLANSLMSEVKSKDETIESQASEIARLNLRLTELQKRAKDHT